ncbi:MAG: response regulator transcription factor [Bacteroidales bacterium]|nr:response regulator transcription factor [Bacteroidales bacterium]
MKALIIEDELRARKHMVNLLTTHFPQMEIVGETASVKDSVLWLSTHPAPDVIFMDVELSDGSSFDIFSHLDVPSPVIMTTAYDQYAVHAFEVNAVDYLLKPIGLEELQRAISRIASGEAVKPASEAVRSILAQARKEKFLIRFNDRIVPIRTADIAYFFSEDKNTYLVTLAGSSYVLDESLDALAGDLEPSDFFRISRSCIISEQVIDSISKLMGGRLRISLRQDIPALTDFTVSRARVDDFLTWLER